MKFSALILACLSFLMIPTTWLKGQCFEKGKKIIDAGIEISIYSVNDPDDDDGDDSGSNAAASYTIPISFEYAFTNRIGAGVEIGICNYFTEEDTVTLAIAKAGSFDVLLKGDFHYVRGGRVDLSSGLGFGISSFHYESNDKLNSKFESTGFYFHLNIFQARFYVAKFLALNLHVGLPHMNFNNGRVSDDLGTDFSYPLAFTGVDIGTGLTVKF